MIRCFNSIEIEDPNILDKLVSVQRSLEGTGGDIKTVERENIHVTLKFLGDVQEGLLEEVKAVVTNVEFEPFQMSLNGVGTFPNLKRPRVIWAGITKGAEETKNIFEQLERGFGSLGFDRERRRFSPHITIARVRSGRNRDQLVKEIVQWRDEDFGVFEVKRTSLKKSVLTPRGPIYSTLAESSTG